MELKAEAAEGPSDERRHREEGERRQDAADEGEEKTHRQATGRRLGALARGGAHVQGEAVERGTERRAVAVTRNEGGNQRPDRFTQFGGERLERVGETTTAASGAHRVSDRLGQWAVGVPRRRVERARQVRARAHGEADEGDDVGQVTLDRVGVLALGAAADEEWAYRDGTKHAESRGREQQRARAGDGKR